MSRDRTGGVIVYVDNEHASVYERDGTEWLLAARARITYRLEDLTGDTCLLQRYQGISHELIAEHGVRAIFISGHGASQEMYDKADRAALREIIRAGTLPVFGFCGGLQFIAETLGIDVVRVGRIPEGEQDPAPSYQPGWIKEIGYQPIRLVGDHPLHEGLGDAPVFRHAHTWELAELPEGFVRLGETDTTVIQMAVHETLPLAGTQFHPEYWTNDAPAGRQLIENWCRFVGLID